MSYFPEKRQMSLLVISLLLALISQTSYCSIDGYLPEREYLNITLPAQTASAPILLSMGKDTILVRVANVNGKSEIQVLTRSKDGKWLPLGDKGNALTGNNGVSLIDAKVDSDGKLWVLAFYTEPSNKLLGGQHLIYSYKNGNWVNENYTEMHQSTSLSWDSGLHFLPNKTLCHIYYDRLLGFQFKHLSKGQRQPVPLEEVFNKMIGPNSNSPQASNINNASWLIWTSYEDKTTKLKAVKITGTEASDISGPYILNSWDNKVTLVKSDVSAQGRIAVCLFDYSYSKEYIQQYAENPQGKYIGKDLQLSRKRTEIGQLKYSPQGQLYVASILSDQNIFLDRYQDLRWQPVNSFNQKINRMQIINPEIYFIDNKAIVIWQDLRLCNCG